jgi:hypothetical protein
MHDKPHAGVNPCERRRLGHLRQAKSFETLHPLNVIQVLYFLERRQIREVDSRHRAAGSFADGRQDTLARRRALATFHGVVQGIAVGNIDECPAAAEVW